MRPSPRLARHVEKALGASGLRAALAQSPVIGVHVRHGDACRPEEEHRSSRRCTPLGPYLTHARRLAATYGAATIYLATDSSSVLQQAQQLH